jgi:hypothetical protein
LLITRQAIQREKMRRQQGKEVQSAKEFYREQQAKAAAEEIK